MTLSEFIALPAKEREKIMLEVAEEANKAQQITLLKSALSDAHQALLLCQDYARTSSYQHRVANEIKALSKVLG